jgi:hypothetical protein
MRTPIVLNAYSRIIAEDNEYGMNLLLREEITPCPKYRNGYFTIKQYDQSYNVMWTEVFYSKEAAIMYFGTLAAEFGCVIY